METPANLEKLLEKIKKYCAYQERSVAEVSFKLKTWKLTDSDIQCIITQLIQENFINEERFVQSFVNGKLNTKKWGRLKLQNQLMQKGIRPDLIRRALGSIQEENYRENLKNTIEKWKRQHELNQDSYPKLCRFLLSKGYEYEVIKKELASKKRY